MHYRITDTGVGDLRLLAPGTHACPQVPPPPASGVAPGGPSAWDGGLAPEEPDPDEEADE